MKPQSVTPTPHPPPAADGNPAYPSLEEREKIVDKHKNTSEEVRKIPADLMHDVRPEDEEAQP
ncbi:MAG TPA: hypothetical protein VIM44_02780 [Rariglobus sp.]